MIWEVRNVGWPIPYGDTWPVSNHKPQPWYPSEQLSQPSNIQNYYKDWFHSKIYKGQIVNGWY